jgi:hypothetical protein
MSLPAFDKLDVAIAILEGSASREVKRGLLTTLASDAELIAALAELIDAATPFATFNSSEPTITVRTSDIARLRTALAHFGRAA